MTDTKPITPYCKHTVKNLKDKDIAVKVEYKHVKICKRGYILLEPNEAIQDSTH